MIIIWRYLYFLFRYECDDESEWEYETSLTDTVRPQYIIFEVPSNIIIKKISPSLWLASITVLWGISTVGMGLVRNVEGLIACRVLLGFFEAGIVPGMSSFSMS